MKKKILFIHSSIDSGGISKSLINLLSVFDYSKYEVDLYLGSFNPDDEKRVPIKVYIFSDIRFSSVVQKFPNGVIQAFKQGNIIAAFSRTLQFLVSRVNRGYGAILLSKLMPRLTKRYDVAIDFAGMQNLCFLIDRVEADKKIGYFHFDYSQWSEYLSMERLYFPKLDALITVSEKCKNEILSFHPRMKDKTHVIHNVSVPDEIFKLANVRVDNLWNRDDVCRIISVGRPGPIKGTDWMIEATRLLKDKGIIFEWLVIGESELLDDYRAESKKLNISDQLHFEGVVSNPYPYIREADIYVHPSRFEGKSIAIDEAKILCKPIIATKYPSVFDQLEDDFSAKLCELNPIDLSEKLECLIESIDERLRLSENLRQVPFTYENELNKLYNLFNSSRN